MLFINPIFLILYQSDILKHSTVQNLVESLENVIKELNQSNLLEVYVNKNRQNYYIIEIRLKENKRRNLIQTVFEADNNITTQIKNSFDKNGKLIKRNILQLIKILNENTNNNHINDKRSIINSIIGLVFENKYLKNDLNSSNRIFKAISQLLSEDALYSILESINHKKTEIDNAYNNILDLCICDVSVRLINKVYDLDNNNWSPDNDSPELMKTRLIFIKKFFTKYCKECNILQVICNNLNDSI